MPINIFLKEDCPASVLLGLCVKKYGMDVFHWEPETLEYELMQDYGEIPRNNLDKIHALITALATDKFYTDYHVFENICRSLCDDIPSIEAAEPLTPEQAAWGVTEVLENDTTPKPFDADIKMYVQEVLHSNGYIKCPESLNFCEYEKKYQVDPLVEEYFEESLKNEQSIKQTKVKMYIEMRKKQILDYAKET